MASGDCALECTALKDSLIRHSQSIHEGVKYACNQCDKKFAQQETLTTHIKSKHEDIKYASNQCDQYSKQSNLANHIKSKHEGQSMNKFC